LIKAGRTRTIHEPTRRQTNLHEKGQFWFELFRGSSPWPGISALVPFNNQARLLVLSVPVYELLSHKVALPKSHKNLLLKILDIFRKWDQPVPKVKLGQPGV